MKIIPLENQQVKVYNIKDFPYEYYTKLESIKKGKRYQKNYVNVVCAFDIETTTISKEEDNRFGTDYGFMYIWQFCIFIDYDRYSVVTGRTWKEYILFITHLTDFINCENRKLVVYVHNLSFEFQFMRNFFEVTNVFATDKREILYAVLNNKVEYRCSYKLSNMGLNKFLEKTKGITVPKLDGKLFNYKKKRFPDTELTDFEIAYSISDVLGLCQAIYQNLIEDDLISIPLTSTGYVRRDFQEVCLNTKGYKRQLQNIALNKTTYLLSREASRGAISGSNHIHTDEVLEEVDSKDIKSSYPYQMATKYYPQSRFLKYTVQYETEKFEKLIDKYCCLIVWSCEKLKLKRYSGIPYISKAKCRAIQNPKCGNGKVYMAEKIGMCCTEIDFQIIRNQYNFTNVKIHEMYCAQRGMLARPFRALLLDMFQIKTDLEDGDKFTYNKYKNKINASFGMMLTDILHPKVIYNPNSEECWKIEEIPDIDKELESYYKKSKSFLSYQHGVWVLAHGRSDLVQGMNIVGNDIVQVDTDSVKHLRNYDKEFNELNQSIINKAESFDVKPYSIKNGKKHYLGVWEHEGPEGEVTYKQFRTLGAKKYADLSAEGDFEITVSGLTKEASKWFVDNGAIERFRPGTYVPPSTSGRTAAIYNDWTDIRSINIMGHEVTLSSNIAIKDVAYTLSATGEWLLMVLDGHISPEEVQYFDGAFKNYRSNN